MPHLAGYSREELETLLDNRLMKYSLTCKQGFSANTIHRMKHGKAITTSTLDTLCGILDCDVNGILEYTKEEVI